MRFRTVFLTLLLLKAAWLWWSDDGGRDRKP